MALAPVPPRSGALSVTPSVRAERSDAPPAPAIRPGARVRLFVPSRGWGGRGRREILLIAAVIAIVVHILVVVGIVAEQRLARKTAALPPPDNPVTLELVEDDKRYSGGAKPTPPSTPVPPAPDQAQEPTRQGPPKAADVPPQPAPPTETTPPDAPDKADDGAKAAAAPQPAQAAEPDIDLDPTNSFGYGRQDDPDIVPASPDKKTNKLPAYPRAAGRRGEQGSVQMLVRIGADGRVTGIDVAVSSGYADLDSAAVKAVSGWRFKPAIRNGAAVPTQMMQTFNYHIDTVPRP